MTHECEWQKTPSGGVVCACGKSRNALPETKEDTMPPRIKGSVGRLFHIGQTTVFAGPRDKLPNDRHLRMLAVLAVGRPGDEKPRIVAEFPSSSKAEEFIEALMLGIDEATPKPISAETEV